MLTQQKKPARPESSVIRVKDFAKECGLEEGDERSNKADVEAAAKKIQMGYAGKPKSDGIFLRPILDLLLSSYCSYYLGNAMSDHIISDFWVQL